MEYPNKAFIVDHVTEIGIGKLKHTLLVVGDTSENVSKYLEETINLKKSNPIWIPNCVYPTIYNQDGTKPLGTQVRILYNTKSWMK